MFGFGQLIEILKKDPKKIVFAFTCKQLLTSYPCRRSRED